MGVQNEQDLLLQIGQGKEASFLGLYEAYWEQVFFYVMGILKDRDEAEDIVQEVFVTVWEMRANLVQVRNIKPYLQTIAKNKTLQRILLDKKKRSCIDVFAEFTENNHVSLDKEYEAKELSLYINREIDDLPPKMKEVFVLSREQNLSHKEIAEQLNISENTVKKQINNSIRRIKTNIGYFFSFLLFLLR